LRIDGGGDRRHQPRRIPVADEPLSQVRLRAGRQLHVVNLSDVGLLAEGEMRLLPGTHVDVHLVTADGRLLVRSRVVRAFVCHVGRDRIAYRGALAFERPVPTGALGYPVPDLGRVSTETPGRSYPDSVSEPPPVGPVILAP